MLLGRISTKVKSILRFQYGANKPFSSGPVTQEIYRPMRKVQEGTVYKKPRVFLSVQLTITKNSLHVSQKTKGGCWSLKPD